MNCKPGDLARIVTIGPLRDKIVSVTTLDTDPSCDEPMWLYEGARIPMGAFGEYVSFRDSQLRPIRPQADDADCESLAWLPPVPTRETVPA